MDAAELWGVSGLAHLTGDPAGSADFSRSAVLAGAQGVADQIRRRCGVALDAATLLAGRAALLGLTRGGTVSAGGATRLLPTRDGPCAVTLSRSDDLDAVGALLEVEMQPADAWSALDAWARTRESGHIVDRARLLGLPAAVLGEAGPAAPMVRRIGRRAALRPLAGLLVADLSSMWAGPLAGHVLAMAGATVVKVETRSRPDGTRGGNADFFDWMNGLKLSHAVDDIGEVRPLLAAADVVIESSRPSALARRRIGPDDVAARPGRVWLRITGHGAVGDAANWVAFGDDASVAGGLVGTTNGTPVFCGDAIADPLTGLAAALAVVESVGRGGGELIDVAMSAVAATYAALPTVAGTGIAPPPRRPPPSASAPRLGADDERVHAIIAERDCAPC